MCVCACSRIRNSKLETQGSKLKTQKVEAGKEGPSLLSMCVCVCPLLEFETQNLKLKARNSKGRATPFSLARREGVYLAVRVCVCVRALEFETQNLKLKARNSKLKRWRLVKRDRPY